MKTIQIGRMFEIYDDSLQAHERLTVTRSRKRDIHYMA